MDKVKCEKLSTSSKISYATGQIGEATIYIMFLVYFVFFLTDVVGFSPVFAGLVSMIGVLWDAVSDPVVGSISDKTRFTSGRRRPFVLGFAIPFGISAGLLFTMFDLGPIALKIYFVVAIIFFFTCYTLWYVPYAAMGAEMTQDYNERTSLHSFKGIGLTIGLFLGSVVPLLLTELFIGRGLLKGTAWSISAFLIGAIAAIAILVCWAGTRGTELETAEMEITTSRMTFWGRYATVLANRPYRYIYVMLILVIMGQTFDGAIVMYYATYYMGMDPKTTMGIMAITPVAGILFAPIVNVMAQKLGKRTAFVIFVAASAILRMCIYFVQPGDVLLLAILLALVAGGNITFWILIAAMSGDVIEVDEWVSGERREGLYFGVFSLLQKISASATMGLLGVYLSVIGYVANVEQTATSVFGLRAGYTIVAAAPVALAAIICLFYPLTSEKHKALREALANKAAGKPFSTKGFEDLIPVQSRNRNQELVIATDG